ncbi:MAG: hypothetical protein H0X29_00265 [Parachlamydiaceae bacterium]|nr:hypothetical protein [Parachlamydiaceae bacterium]
MIIKCIENRRSSLTIEEQEGVPDKDYIRIRKEYVVYGILQFGQRIKFCVNEEKICSYPTWCLSSFFEIINPLGSRYWLCSIKLFRPKRNGYRFS